MEWQWTFKHGTNRSLRDRIVKSYNVIFQITFCDLFVRGPKHGRFNALDTSESWLRSLRVLARSSIPSEADFMGVMAVTNETQH